MPDACRYCAAPIVWAVNEKRHRVPVEPHDGGDVVLLAPAPESGSMLPRVILREGAYAQPEWPIASERGGIFWRRHSESCRARSRKGRR